MALARTRSVVLLGVQGYLVEIEADIAAGLPGVSLIGLPDAALTEARDRIRAAIVNSGQKWPSQRITLALSPADIRKQGSHFDVALAIAVLAASEVVEQTNLNGLVLLGELALDGTIRSVRGVLPAVVTAVRAGFPRVIVPVANAAEAALVPEAEVRAVETLSDLVALLTGEPCEVVTGVAPTGAPPTVTHDLADVVGQAQGRRALEIAAAGGHHLYLTGPPGAGKTMLAERLPGLLPMLRSDEALEVTAVHSVAGILPPDAPLVSAPPFQAPHHTATVASLVGGGSGMPRPGAASCAHRGVLFLDEAPELAGGTLDALREPMERGEVSIARAAGLVRFPARFQLVLASNPCPCASAAGDSACTCPPGVRRRYLAKLSGPLLDRIDLRVELFPLVRSALFAEGARGETSEVVARRVATARSAAAARWLGTPWHTNAEVPGTVLRSRWRLPPRVLVDASKALEQGEISARGFDRVLRCAWTIADLGGHSVPDRYDVSEAVGLRIGAVAA
ncbi:MAG TPA: YifB family Mg chelatase-like AAA ATPase [Mycobacteriales bacterium]|nr:YifB family Mg chelatase-like AAA ATPase [Mycobacteriales bacterium]